jgi:hypothetical protein
MASLPVAVLYFTAESSSTKREIWQIKTIRTISWRFGTTTIIELGALYRLFSVPFSGADWNLRFVIWNSTLNL